MLSTTQEKLLKYIYEEFAVGTSEAQQFLGVKRESTALKHLHSLEPAIGCTYINASRDSRDADGKYQELTWQCWYTYDDNSWEECLAQSKKCLENQAKADSKDDEVISSALPDPHDVDLETLDIHDLKGTAESIGHPNTDNWNRPALIGWILREMD